MTKESLKLFFTYFGGKYRIAKHYPEPKYKKLIEPFAGSAGYALHYPEKQVSLYDKDPIICGVWGYLIKAKEAEILSLPLEISDLRDMNLPEESKYLIGFWLNKGSAAPRNIPSKWMRSNVRPNSYWGEVIRKRIADQLQYIRHWNIKNISYNEIDDCDATWFIDPPYEKSGVLYRYKDIDYNHLSEWCKKRCGQVIVCEQNGADWLPFKEFRTIKSLEGIKGSKQSKEVVWYKNG